MWGVKPPGTKHKHVAIEGPREQGQLFFNIRDVLKDQAALAQAKAARGQK